MSKKYSFMGALQPTGYGIASMSIARALHELGHEVRFFDISQGIGELYYNTAAEQNILTKLSKDALFFDHDAPCIRMWHQFGLDKWVGRGKKWGWPIFELDKFNDLEKHHLGFPDELIVCSQWAADVIKAETDRNAHVVPLGVDTTIFHPGSEERDEEQPFVFMNIGKWEVRKGHDILADIYNMAFRPDDNVRLHVLAPLWASASERRDWIEYYKNTDMGSTIQFIDRQPSHLQVAEIIRSCDCGVFPARAEGWNMELLEMMSCGRPVIAVNYSGQTEYMSEDNCMLVEPDGLETAADGKWFHGQGSWANIGEAEMQQFADHMRAIYEDWKFNHAGVATAEAFSWTNAARKFAEIVE
jgi:glycosyltransferase involved in cell wall biosynthesis